jgi:hypothetical protein
MEEEAEAVGGAGSCIVILPFRQWAPQGTTSRTSGPGAKQMPVGEEGAKGWAIVLFVRAIMIWTGGE